MVVNIRFFICLFVVIIVTNCAYVRARHLNNFGKRIWGCSKLHESCSGLSSKCCNGFVCHKNTGKCVYTSQSGSGSSGSWLDHRNGK